NELIPCPTSWFQVITDSYSWRRVCARRSAASSPFHNFTVLPLRRVSFETPGPPSYSLFVICYSPLTISAFQHFSFQAFSWFCYSLFAICHSRGRARSGHRPISAFQLSAFQLLLVTHHSHRSHTSQQSVWPFSRLVFAA